MPSTPSPEQVGAILESERRGVYARLVHNLGDFDLAEDAVQDAFTAALAQWPAEGIPDNPHAWLHRVAKFRAIDTLRRRGRLKSVEDFESEWPAADQDDPEEIGDEVLRLIFTCCHPSISPEAQVALTLREVCGLTTEEIASAFLVPAPTLAQRIVRAKTKIRDAKIPFEIPSGDELADRLSAVLRTIYLVFNEGYSASSGEQAIRRDLVVEATRLGRMLLDLLPDPEVIGLLSLMLLSQARMAARLSPEGEVVLLEDQDRSLWDRRLIEEGSALVRRALGQPGYGSYTLQAAISAVHCEAPTYRETDWAEIVGLYDALLLVEPSPVVELNRAVAVAMRDGLDAGISLIDLLLDSGQLEGYHVAFVARGSLHERAGRRSEAQQDFRRALELASNEPARRFIEGRIAELGTHVEKLRAKA